MRERDRDREKGRQRATKRPKDRDKVTKDTYVILDMSVGRYIVATEDIEVGETLLCEEPLVSYLHSSHRLSNCTNCLRYCIPKDLTPNFGDPNHGLAHFCFQQKTIAHKSLRNI